MQHGHHRHVRCDQQRHKERQSSGWLWNNDQCIDECVHDACDRCHTEQVVGHEYRWSCKGVEKSGQNQGQYVL